MITVEKLVVWKITDLSQTSRISETSFCHMSLIKHCVTISDMNRNCATHIHNRFSLTCD